MFGTIWQLVQNWLGVHSADPAVITDHFLQVSNSSKLFKIKKLFRVIDMVCEFLGDLEGKKCWMFRGKENIPLRLLENIKIISV